jgi:PKD repeat protein
MKLVRTLLCVLLMATLSGLGGVRDGQASRRLSVATTSAPHARPVAGREMLSPLTLHAAPPLVPQGGGGKTFSYVLGPLSASDSVAEFNRMGAQGYAFYIETTVGGGNYIYVKDSTRTGTYAYSARPQPATAADTLAQMNAMGAQGYSFYREIPISGGPGYLYVKDASHSGNFNYTIMPTPSTSSETLARMNAMGAQGYAYYMPTRFGDLYVKDSARAVTYSYAFGPFTSSFADTLAQMNGFGAQGYALLANSGFVSQNSFGNIYVKDSSRSGTYTFALAPFPASAAGGLQQLNAMGAAGAAYMTEYWVSPGGIHFVYMGFREGGACAYALSHANQSFGASGGSGTINVSSPAGCLWSAVSEVGWITVSTGQSGGGNGAVGFTVAANNGASQRSGVILVGGQRFTVTQAGNCTKPAVTTQPTGRTISSGQQLALTVAASGTVPFTYQWYRGNKGDTSNPVTGATASSFTTPALTSAARYWVRVRNACGSDDSDEAKIWVSGSCNLGCAASVPAEAGTGEAVNFAATHTLSTCSAAPTVNWTFGDSTGSASGQSLRHTYTAPGTYNWSATVVAGTAVCSQSGIITVRQRCRPPQIINQPRSVANPPGRQAQLNLTAWTERGPLRFQWYEVQSDGALKPVAEMTAAAFQTPVLSATTVYIVRVINDCNLSVDSNPVVVTIGGPSKLRVEAIDPNCDQPQDCNGAYLRETAGVVGVVPDPARLAAARVIRSRVVADGVTLLVIRARSASNSPVTFALPARPGIGELITLGGTQKGSLIKVVPSLVQGAFHAFVVYRSPLNFPGAKASVTATADDGAQGETSLTFQRPPVVILHGVWSSRTEAWRQDTGRYLKDYLRDLRIPLCERCQPDYSSVGKATGSFDPLATDPHDQRIIGILDESVRSTLTWMRAYNPDNKEGPNTAVTQVDSLLIAWAG